MVWRLPLNIKKKETTEGRKCQKISESEFIKLCWSKNGKLGKKDTQLVADQFGLHIRTVQLLWKQGKTQLAKTLFPWWFLV